MFFADGACIRPGSIAVAAGFCDAPDAATSRLYFKFGREWLAHEVSEDFIVSVAYGHGGLVAVGRHGSVRRVGRPGLRLEPKNVVGKILAHAIEGVPENGPLERVKWIGPRFYACGWGGQIYRSSPDGSKLTRLPMGGFEDCDFCDVAGNSDADVYAVGLGGVALHFDGVRWRRMRVPTLAHINSVRCSPAGGAILSDSEGVVWRGSHSPNRWRRMASSSEGGNVWSTCTFRDRLYAAAGAKGLLVEENGSLRACPPTRATAAMRPCRLGADARAMWVFGPNALLRYDGRRWTEVRCPDNE